MTGKIAIPQGTENFSPYSTTYNKSNKTLYVLDINLGKIYTVDDINKMTLAFDLSSYIDPSCIKSEFSGITCNPKTNFLYVTLKQTPTYFDTEIIKNSVLFFIDVDKNLIDTIPFDPFTFYYDTNETSLGVFLTNGLVLDNNDTLWIAGNIKYFGNVNEEQEKKSYICNVNINDKKINFIPVEIPNILDVLNINVTNEENIDNYKWKIYCLTTNYKTNVVYFTSTISFSITNTNTFAKSTINKQCLISFSTTSPYNFSYFIANEDADKYDFLSITSNDNDNLLYIVGTNDKLFLRSYIFKFDCQQNKIIDSLNLSTNDENQGAYGIIFNPSNNLLYSTVSNLNFKPRPDQRPEIEISGFIYEMDKDLKIKQRIKVDETILTFITLNSSNNNIYCCSLESEISFGNVYYVELQSNNLVCFKENTKILTNEGYKPIQILKKGDLVKTLKDGFKSINMIGQREITNILCEERIKDKLYIYSNNEYSEIFEPLVITGSHSILREEFRSEVEKVKAVEILGGLYGTDGLLRIPVCVDELSKSYEKEGIFKIYHIALENENQYLNYGIYANGLLVESCSKWYLKEMSNMESL
uniref:Hedgehog/Intein (Hint) domain-containing protein n=1 Tax=viral metagenome TaxID=1070528 RepID=A0A6C0KQD8_9ZZZZ